MSIFKEASSKDISSLPLTPLGVKILTGRYDKLLEEYFINLKTIMVNSAPLPPEYSNKLFDVFPKIRLLVYYGLTEASRSTFHELSRSNEGSLIAVGKPIGDTKVK